MSFVTLFSWMDRYELDASSESFSASGQLMDGCTFLLQLKHSLSFQYSLSKGLLPLPHMFPLPLPPLWPLPPCTNSVPSDCAVLCTTVFLYLSGCAGSVDGSWGIGCPQLLNHSATSLSDFHVECHSTSGNCRMVKLTCRLY